MRSAPRQSTWPAKPSDGERDKRLKKAMKYAKEPGMNLSPEMRHELAKMLPSVDQYSTGSWADLTVKQLDDLLNMLEGWVFITYLKEQRGDFG